MSDKQKRRKFLADALFAGGALGAAALGARWFVPPAVSEPDPQGSPTPQRTPDATPSNTPTPVPQRDPALEVHPGGAVAPRESCPSSPVPVQTN